MGRWRGAFQLSSLTMKVSFSIMDQSSLPPHALLGFLQFMHLSPSVHEPTAEFPTETLIHGS